MLAWARGSSPRSRARLHLGNPRTQAGVHPPVPLLEALNASTGPHYSPASWLALVQEAQEGEADPAVTSRGCGDESPSPSIPAWLEGTQVMGKKTSYIATLAPEELLARLGKGAGESLSGD